MRELRWVWFRLDFLGRVMGWLSVNQLDGLPDLFGPLLGLSGIESSQLMVSSLS